MWRNVTPGLIVVGLTLAYSGALLAAPACVETEPGKLRCAIEKAADCDRINDYPYARDLFCAAAFSAAQAMVAEVAQTLGVKAPKDGFFHFFQTLPDPSPSGDDPLQTTIACAKTPFAGGSKDVLGAGDPLCNLVAYVTSPGPDAKKEKKDEPIPHSLRDFPDYFSNLYAPEKKHALAKFRTGSAFDKLVIGLGAGGYDGFTVGLQEALHHQAL